MKRTVLQKAVVLLPILTLSSLSIACGGRPCADPSESVSVSKTQNPLVAQYAIGSPCAGTASVEFGPDLWYGTSTASYPVPAGSTGVKILVAGMKASSTYPMRSRVECATSSLGITPIPRVSGNYHGPWRRCRRFGSELESGLGVELFRLSECEPPSRRPARLDPQQCLDVPS